MLFGAKSDREWASGDRHHNAPVFIGRDLDRTALPAALKSFLV